MSAGLSTANGRRFAGKGTGIQCLQIEQSTALNENVQAPAVGMRILLACTKVEQATNDCRHGG